MNDILRIQRCFFKHYSNSSTSALSSTKAAELIIHTDVTSDVVLIHNSSFMYTLSDLFVSNTVICVIVNKDTILRSQ